MGLLRKLRRTAAVVKSEVLTIYYVMRDVRTPLWLKLLALAVVLYAVNPFDLIPDWIPILGWLDDAVVLPMGVALIMRLTPHDVLEESRAAAAVSVEKLECLRRYSGILLALTVAGVVGITWLIARWLSGHGASPSGH